MILFLHKNIIVTTGGNTARMQTLSKATQSPVLSPATSTNTAMPKRHISNEGKEIGGLQKGKFKNGYAPLSPDPFLSPTLALVPPPSYPPTSHFTAKTPADSGTSCTTCTPTLTLVTSCSLAECHFLWHPHFHPQIRLVHK